MIPVAGGRLRELTLEGGAFRAAAGPWTRRRVLLLAVWDGNGHEGWGEACPLPGYSPDTLDQARSGLEAWISRIPRKVDLLPTSPPSLEGAGGADLPASARCAVEGALLDLASRRAGMPLHRWLGAGTGVVVESQGLIELSGVEVARTRARELWAAGFRTLKVKGGEDFEREAQLLRLLREEFGDGLSLRLDVGGRWSADQARFRLEALEPLGLDYVEEPVAAPGLLALGDAPIPLAADESLQDPVLAGEIIAAGVCEALVLKPSCIGGPVQALRLARAAQRQGMGWALSHTLGSGIERALAVEVALASGASTSGLAEHPFLPPSHRPPAWSGPILASLERPGLGLGGEEP